MFFVKYQNTPHILGLDQRYAVERAPVIQSRRIYSSLYFYQRKEKKETKFKKKKTSEKKKDGGNLMDCIELLHLSGSQNLVPLIREMLNAIQLITIFRQTFSLKTSLPKPSLFADYLLCFRAKSMISVGKLPTASAKNLPVFHHGHQYENIMAPTRQQHRGVT